MNNLTSAALADGTYTAFIHGSCIGNPGPSGAAFKLFAPDDQSLEGTRSSPSATNNSAAMCAVRDALKKTPEGATVRIMLVCNYIKDNFENRLQDWSKSGWRKSKGKELANKDWWKEIYELAKTRQVTFQKIEADSGYPEFDDVKCAASKVAEKAYEEAYVASRDGG